MIARFAFCTVATGLYAYRIVDPSGAFNTFFSTSEWLTGVVLEPLGAPVYVRNFINLLLVDQFEWFLLGVIFALVVSLLLSALAILGCAFARGLRCLLTPLWGGAQYRPRSPSPTHAL